MELHVACSSCSCVLCSIGARQFKVTINDLIIVNRLQVADIGDEIFLNKVKCVCVCVCVECACICVCVRDGSQC